MYSIKKLDSTQITDLAKIRTNGLIEKCPKEFESLLKKVPASLFILNKNAGTLTFKT